MGLDQDALTYAFIDTAGKRVALAGRPVLLSTFAYGLADSGKLMRFPDEQVEIPAGCKVEDGAEGSGVTVIGCGKATELFDPVRGTRHRMPDGQSVKFIEGTRRAGADGTWYAVALPIAGATHHSSARVQLARLRIEDLRIERGPLVFFHRNSENPAWLVAGRGDEYFLMHLGSGRLLTATAKDTDTDYSTLALRTGSKAFLLLDPDSGLQARTRRAIGIGNGYGCFIAAGGERSAGMSDIDVGPWMRVCVEKMP